MIPEQELGLLNSCRDASFIDIKFVNNKSAFNTSVKVYEDYIAGDFGFIISFSNGTGLFFKWAEDDFGDPYRIEIWNSENLNTDAVQIRGFSEPNYWQDLKGKTLSHYEILSYRSSYKRKGIDGLHNVAWGIELDFEGSPLFLGILDSQSPFEGGTTREMLTSTNVLFMTELKMKFEGYVGFYGEL